MTPIAVPEASPSTWSASAGNHPGQVTSSRWLGTTVAVVALAAICVVAARLGLMVDSVAGFAGPRCLDRRAAADGREPARGARESDGGQSREGGKPRETVEHVRAAAEAIPLRARSTDLVFMSMSFHHFDDPSRALGECARILSQDGWAVLRTGTREQIPGYPYTPFFPPAVPIMHEVLPDLPGTRDAFAGAGFVLASAEIVEQTIAPDWNAYADKLAAGGDSVLARLRDEELAEGIALVREHAREAKSETVVEPIDLLIFQLAGGT